MLALIFSFSVPSSSASTTFLAPKAFTRSTRFAYRPKVSASHLITPAEAAGSASAIDADSASEPAITPIDVDAFFIAQVIVRAPDMIGRKRRRAYWWSMILSENRYPLFGIMLLLVEHDLVRKPVSTFRDHALIGGA